MRASDMPGLLLLYSSTGHAEGIEKLAELARKKGKLRTSHPVALALHPSPYPDPSPSP